MCACVCVGVDPAALCIPTCEQPPRKLTLLSTAPVNCSVSIVNCTMHLGKVSLLSSVTERLY